jgi:hypothetical protein
VIAALKKETFGSLFLHQVNRYGPSGRKRQWQENGAVIAALPPYSGNALPLFCRCRPLIARKPLICGAGEAGTLIAL